jgi:CDP-glycerol glycerophosphotransferase
MRKRLIAFLKRHPKILRAFWAIAGWCLRVIGRFVRVREKTAIFASFGGRNFDDSPKAVYEQMRADARFKDWKLYWAFVEPSKFDIPQGEKVKIDTPKFFKALMFCQVWVGNSSITRGVDLYPKKKQVRVETWHGTPLKKIGGDENTNSMEVKKKKAKKRKDFRTVRCAQSAYDREIFMRIYNADESAFLTCDLPRNDALKKYTAEDIQSVKEKLGVPQDKKIILYMPTYREYAYDSEKKICLAPPMDTEKWQKALGNAYCLLVRAHYMVESAMGLQENEFLKVVSSYPYLNDLYAVADILISDYSSAFIDYSILNRPMLCFAYDKEEYEQKRGLYIDLEKELPCAVRKTEEEVIDDILHLDYALESEKTDAFRRKYAPNAGNASQAVLEKILQRIKEMKA